jgi:hypothetical protein
MAAIPNPILPRSTASAPNSFITHRSTREAFWNSSAECGNSNCSGTWLSFLKDRRRPVFEENWCCGSRCLGALVDAAVRREARDSGVANEEIRHRHRVPLGLILLAQGRITHTQLQHALDTQRRAGSGRIGRWLSQECGLAEDHITRALCVQWGCPALSTEGFAPEAMALALPRLFVETLGIVPLRIAGGRILYLASASSVDTTVAVALERMTWLKVAPGLLDPVQLREAEERLCACSFVEAACESVADLQSMSRRITSTLAAAEPRASRLVRLHRFFWLRMWLETGAMRTREGGLPRSREDVVDRIYTVGSEQ